MKSAPQVPKIGPKTIHTASLGVDEQPSLQSSVYAHAPAEMRGSGDRLDELRDAAFSLHDRGINVLPVIDKRPACGSYKQYQDRDQTRAEVDRLFLNNSLTGVAILNRDRQFCRDFDGEAGRAAYGQWATDHPDLAAQLPTVQTGNGYHVYGATANSNNETKYQADGEYRGHGCYNLAPPSRHPEGSLYRYKVPFPDGALLIVDPVKVGLLTACVTETPETPESHLCGLCGPLSSLSQCEREAIAETLPTRQGERNKKLFAFARKLKSMAQFADAPVQDLRDLVREWHRQALPMIGTKSFDESWQDFVHGWKRVRFQAGEDPMSMILQQLDTANLPSVAGNYDTEATRRLVGICYELQRSAGNDPFFMSCRMASKLTGLDHNTAWRRLKMLEADQVITVAKPGTKTRATRYHFTGGSVDV